MPEGYDQIRFGDAIVLKQHNCNTFFTRSITTQGFGISFVQIEPEHPYPPDLADAVFVLLPAAKYTHADKLTKLKAQQVSLDPAADPFVSSLMNAVESEKTINDIETRRQTGVALVRYGDPMRLQHQATGAYLTCDVFGGDEQGMARLTLQPDNAVIFEVVSAFKTDAAADCLYTNQAFCLKSKESRLQVGCVPEGVDLGHEPLSYVVAQHRSLMQTAGTLLSAQVFREYSNQEASGAKDAADAACGGMVVRLHHCEHSAYLGCVNDEDTSFDLSKVSLIGGGFGENEEESEELDLRSLWRLDLLMDRGRQGDPLTCQTQVSLRHYVTGKYLCKGLDGTLSLSADYLAVGALWSLQALRGGALNQAIRIMQSRVLLTCDEDVLVAPDRVLQCVSTDHELVSCTQAHVFRLEPFEMVNIVRIAEANHKRAEQLYNAVVQVGVERDAIAAAVAKHAQEIIACYGDMIRECSTDTEMDPAIRDGIANTGNQRMMAQLGTIGLTVAFIGVILNDSARVVDPALPSSVVDPMSSKAVTLMFRYLRQIVKANNTRRHVSKLEEHLEFLYRYLNSDYKVVDTLSELIADNPQMLKHTVTPDFVHHIADTLYTQHQEKLCGARFVNTLRIMCSLDGQPLEYNQNVVLFNSFVSMMQMKDTPFSRVRISEDGDVQISSPKLGRWGYSSADVNWIEMSSFQARGTKNFGVYEKYLFVKPLRDCTDNEKSLRMHVETIKFFSELVAGRNVLNVQSLLQYSDFFALKYDLLLAAINNTELPSFYRRYLINIIRNIFVDCEPHQQIKFSKEILVTNATPAPARRGSSQTSSTFATDRFFDFPDLRPPPDSHRQLKKALIKILQTKGCFETDNYDANLLMMSCLTTLNMILQFGMCSDADDRTLSDLLPVLIELLGTENERYFTFDTFTSPIINAKLMIADMLQSVMDVRASARLTAVHKLFDTQFLSEFDRLGKQDRLDQKFQFDNVRLAQVLAEVLSDPIPHTDVVLSPSEIEAPPDHLTLQLLGLIKYDSRLLQSRAFHMLFRHRGQKEGLVRVMKRSYLVVHPTLMQANVTLKAEVEDVRPHIKWLSHPASPYRADAMRICRRMLPRWCQMISVGSVIELPAEQRLVELEIDEFFAKRLARLLFNHDAHRCAIQMLALNMNTLELTSIQLNQLVQDCDVDGNSVLDPDEYQQICLKLVSWVFEGSAEEGCPIELPAVDTDVAIEEVQTWLGRFFRENYQAVLCQLWDSCFELLGAMCRSSEEIQTQIAQSLSLTDPEPSHVIRQHLDRESLVVIPFLCDLVTENSYVCNNFEAGIVQSICEKMLRTKDPILALLISKLCRPDCDGPCCERNVAIVMDSIIGHTDGLVYNIKAERGDKHEINEDLPDPAQPAAVGEATAWHTACLHLLAALVQGTCPKELEFVQSLVSLDMCIAGICLPLPLVTPKKVRIRKQTKQKVEAATSRLSVDETSMLQKLFNRYDLNDNGVLDDVNELTQLTLNCAVSFRLRVSVPKMEALCADTNISAFNAWSFEQFCEWFAENLMTQKTPESPGDVEAELIDLKFDEEDDNDSEEEFANPKYTSTTKDILLIKGAYLKLWTQCYVNVIEDATMRMMTAHAECDPPSTIFPQGELDPAGSKSVMCSIVQLLVCLSHNPELMLDENVAAVVTDGIVPCLTSYLVDHLKDVLPHNRKKLQEVFFALANFKTSALSRGHLVEDDAKALDTLLTMASRSLGESKLDKSRVHKASIFAPNDMYEREDAAEHQWQLFVTSCIEELGLHEDKDDITIIGDSIKSIAIMLCRDQIPGGISARMVLHRMFDTLAQANTICPIDRSRMDKINVCNMLAMARAIIYVDQSSGQEQEDNWQRFIQGGEVDKDECMHEKLWTQWKLAELGAPDVLTSLAASEDVEVQMACIRFGIALLEGGNTLVQDELLATLKRRTHSQATKFITCVLRELNEAKSELNLIMMTNETAEEKAEEKEMEECEEAFSALGFWQTLAEGHHLGWQRFIGNRADGDVDVFQELEEVLKISIETTMRLEHTTVLDLLDAIFGVYKELVEGPCYINQMTLASGGAIANITNLLFDIQLLDSAHVPTFVDTLHCDPPHTFKPPLQAAHSILSADTTLRIKEGIYGVLTSLMDGSDREVLRAIARHLDPLCLLRDIFAVDPQMLYRTEFDLGTNLPPIYQSTMAKYQRWKMRFYQTAQQTSQEEVTKYKEEQKSIREAIEDPNSLRHAELAKTAYLVFVILEEAVIDKHFAEGLQLMRSGKEPLWTKYYDILETRISTTEITLDETHNYHTYRYNFVIPDICHHLRGFQSWTEHVKREMDVVPRDNSQHKQVEFVRCINSRLVEIDHFNELLDYTEYGPWGCAFFTFLVNQQDSIDAAPFFWAALVVIVLCITYGYDHTAGHQSYDGYPGAKVSVDSLGVLCVLSLLLLLFKHFIVIVPYQVALSLKSVKGSGQAQSNLDGLTLHQTLHGRTAPALLPGQKPYEQSLNNDQFEVLTDCLAEEGLDLVVALKWIMTDPGCWYFVTLFLLAFIALCLEQKGRFMFALIMVDYLRRPDGQMMLMSIKEGAPGLLGSARVAIVIIMNYACVSYWLFQDEIQVYNDCKTAYQCVMKSVEAGLQGDMAALHGDDFWNVFQSFPLGIDDKSKKQAQWWFVQTYFVLWNYIIAGIVQGYIVDAFSAIRGAQCERDNDSQSKCLVCSLDKFVLEAAGVSFETHTEDRHNRWAYLYVAVTTQIKPQDEHGTTESVVKAALEHDGIGFLPLETCVILQEKEAATKQNEAASKGGGPEAGIEDRLHNIEEQLALILDQVPAR